MGSRHFDQSMEYVPLYTSIFENKKIFSLMEKHSNEGLVFYIKMLCFIYKNSYFIEWTADSRLDFNMDMRINDQNSDIIIQTCMDLGLFHKDTFIKHSIITTPTIQKIWLRELKRRKKLVMHTKSILVDYQLIHDMNIDGLIILNDENKEVEVIRKKSRNKQKIQIKRVSSAGKSPRTEKFDRKYIKAFIKIPWEQRPPDFTNIPGYTADLYRSYVRFNEEIQNYYPGILLSEKQINFDEFIHLCKTKKFAFAEAKIILDQIEKSEVYRQSSIADLFITYLDLYREANKTLINRSVRQYITI